MYTYTGPNYRICMVTPDGRKADPRSWTQQQITNAIHRWPSVAEWFTIQKTAPKPDSKKDAE